ILSAEGQRESAIKTAEGQKAAQILSAEGAKTAAILAAEADRQSRILRAEGERAARYLSAQGQAKAIETTFNAIHAAKPDPALLAYQYLQTLPQIAQGDANKMWIVPSEFSKALEGLAGLAGGGSGGSEAGTGAPAVPSWLAATSTSNGGRSDTADGEKISTDGWFDSNLPPAAIQPEASLRASDDDPDSRAAHEGIAELPELSAGIDPSAPPAVPPLPRIPPLPDPEQLRANPGELRDLDSDR
ncbi:MAG TPA: SPFH domain-containing protein, partial [Jatrophihabitans sp.]|nr:SPFH domain-containing protein [Jatrophihabitans sp.]